MSASIRIPKPSIPLVLGGNVFGWTANIKASFEVLDAFADAGGSWIDTADIYSSWVSGHRGGESESVIGAWLRAGGRTKNMVVVTKVGMLDGEGGTGLHPARIAAAAEASLKRLGVEAIDLYLAHLDDSSIPLEESLAAFDKLVRAGKVKAIGASNFSAIRLAEALSVSAINGFARFSVIEPHYNLVQRAGFEGELQDLVVAQRLCAIPYFGLASGYLAGRYRRLEDLRNSPRAEWIRPVIEGQGPAVLDVLDQIQRETGHPLAALALAWLASQPGVTAPIASATSVSQLEDLLQIRSVTLTDEQMGRLTQAGHVAPVAGPQT